MYKKVIHIVSSLNTGGAEKFVKNLSIQQQSNGHKITVISFGCKSDTFQPSIEDNNIQVINLSGGLIKRLKELYSELKKADVIHIHSPAVIRAISPISFLLLKHNIIYTIHGEIDPPEKLLAFSHKVALFYLKKIVAVSESSKQSVGRRYGWHIDKVSVIKNGVVVEKNDNIKDINFPIKLGTVSRLIPLKNISLLFNAIELMNTSDANKFSINVFGSGPDNENLRKKALELKDTVTTHFWGNVIDEKDIYDNIDLLIVCSDNEGLPMSILEAMANKIPVVSTKVGAIPKLVLEDHGWLYNKRNPEELAVILKDILTNIDNIRLYGEKSCEFVKQRYSIETIANDYDVIYSDYYNG